MYKYSTQYSIIDLFTIRLQMRRRAGGTGGTGGIGEGVGEGVGGGGGVGGGARGE